MAENIPDISKSLHTPPPLQKSGQQPVANQSDTPSQVQGDSVSVTSIDKWVEKLKAMPEPELDPALLKEIEEALPEKLEGQVFDEEVFPTIANELARDWGLSDV